MKDNLDDSRVKIALFSCVIQHFLCKHTPLTLPNRPLQLLQGSDPAVRLSTVLRYLEML